MGRLIGRGGTLGSGGSGESEKVAVVVAGYGLQGCVLLHCLVENVEVLQQKYRVGLFLVSLDTAEQHVEGSAGGQFRVLILEGTDEDWVGEQVLQMS